MNFELNAEIREDQGKGASRRLRHTDKMPAIIYGGDKEPVAIAIAQNKMLQALDHDEVYESEIAINVDGNVEKVKLQDLQRHPFKHLIIHADFKRV